MPILNPDHLFEQADKLVTPPVGRPRQVDLRRAISGAYYGLFHFAMTSIADQFVGKTQRATNRYALLYRAVQHKTLKEVCDETIKPTVGRRYAAYFPVGGFGPEIQAFAVSAASLQEKRHLADYDPMLRFVTSDAKLAIEAARSAVENFSRADQEQQRAFLTLLLCQPR